MDGKTNDKPKRIKCERCVYRARDKKVGDEIIYGATLGTCIPYPIKPPPVLYKDEYCPYFSEENR